MCVVDIGSITRAAQALHIAQPALSKHLSDLEHVLDATLLVRGPQGIQPTEQGRALHTAAQRILRDVDSVAAEVAAMGREPVGTVRLGCLESTSMCLAYPLAVTIMQRFPAVRLVMLAGQGRDLYRRLLAGDLDLVVLSPDEEVTGLHTRALVDEELFVVGAQSMPGLGEGPVIELEALAELPFVLSSKSSFSTRTLMKGAFATQGFELHAVIEADALGLVRRLVLEGHGCSVLPWTVVQEEVGAGKVLLKRVRGVPLLRRLELCRRPDQPKTAAAAAVTGAGTGIGLGIATVLAEEGAKLVLVGRRADVLQAAAEKITALGWAAPIVMPQDLTTQGGGAELAHKALAACGAVDILVNNAGVSQTLSTIGSDEAWDAAYALRFKEVRHLIEALLPAMKVRRFSRIINVGGSWEAQDVINSASVMNAARTV